MGLKGRLASGKHPLLLLARFSDLMPTLLTQADFARLRLDWLWVYEADVPEAGKWSRNEIVVPCGVFFVLEGCGELEVAGKRLEAGKGMVFLSSQGVRRQWFAPGTRLLSVGFRAMWLHHGPLLRFGLNRVVSSKQAADLESATRRLYRKVHGGRKDVGFRQAVLPAELGLRKALARESAFREWFLVYLDCLERLGIPLDLPAPVKDPRLGQVLRLLEEWPLDRRPDLEEIADRAGVVIGRRRLEQLLRAETGASAGELLERRRLAVACELLQSTGRPMKEVSHGLGFHHASHFTKWFRRATGLTPSRYRSSAVGLA